MITPTPLPCDSPKVVIRKSVPNVLISRTQMERYPRERRFLGGVRMQKKVQAVPGESCFPRIILVFTFSNHITIVKLDGSSN